MELVDAVAEVPRQEDADGHAVRDDDVILGSAAVRRDDAKKLVGTDRFGWTTRNFYRSLRIEDTVLFRLSV